MRPPAIQFEVVPGSRQPVYRQIAAQIADAIAERALRPGDALMPYRELAELYVLSPVAVRKAYEELVLEGLCHHAGDAFFVSPEAADWQAQRSRSCAWRATSSAVCCRRAT